MTDPRATTPTAATGRRRRRDTMLLTLNVVLLGASVALFITLDSGLTRWLALVVSSLNTFTSWQIWRAR